MTAPAPVTRCVRCRLARCVCAELERVELETRVVIVRHRSERSRVSNTGHFAQLAIAGLLLLEYGELRAPFDESRLPVGDGTFLLFPGGPAPAMMASTGRARPTRLIVLDASWSQARKMRRRIQALRGLPLLSLPPPALARRRLRRPLDAYGMSTLEAIAGAVALLEGEDRAAPLERLHDAIVRASLTTLRASIYSGQGVPSGAGAGTVATPRAKNVDKKQPY